MVTPNREVLIRYGELFLKSDPVKRIHEKKLKDNIRTALKNAGVKKFEIERKRGRMFVKVTARNINKACKVLAKVFGIVSFSPCWHLETSDIKKIQAFVKKNYVKWIKRGEKFAVRAKRTGVQRGKGSGRRKYTSMQLAKLVGDVVNRKVNLSKPDVEIGVEVRDNDCYIFVETFAGLGGLPVSASGKVLSLISAGIDSPVATWLMMKRGCSVTLLHFHSFPLVSRKSIEKTKRLAKILTEYQNKIKVYFVPFQDIQMEIKTKILAKYRIVLYRRFMLRIAEEIAKLEKAKALVTGESLAQVSSQTLDNMVVIEDAISGVSVLRPVIGMDKVEIIDLAKRIDTYEISIEPHEDCCTLFVPRHPTTKAKLSVVKKLEKNLKIKNLVKKAVKDAEVIFVEGGRVKTASVKSGRIKTLKQRKGKKK